MTRASATAAFLTVATAVVLILGAVPRAEAPGPQIQAGDLANWADRSTWSTPDRETRMTEVGMGLVLDGPSGAMRLALFVNQPTRGTASEPSSIGFRVASTLRMNPNLVRRPTLMFAGTMPSADNPDELEEFDVDLSSALIVNDPSPMATINSGTGRMAADQLRKLAAAVELSAEIMGAPVDFREDQIKAIKAYCDKLLPEKQ